MMTFKIKHLILAGTFDRFHPGHQFLFDIAISIAQQLSVGLTTNKFAKRAEKLLYEDITDYSIRAQNIKKYLLNNNFTSFHIIPINDKMGFAGTSKATHIMVTEETINTLSFINNVRLTNNLTALIPVVAPRIVNKETQIIYSSSQIRSDERAQKNCSNNSP